MWLVHWLSFLPSCLIVNNTIISNCEDNVNTHLQFLVEYVIIEVRLGGAEILQFTSDVGYRLLNDKSELPVLAVYNTRLCVGTATWTSGPCKGSQNYNRTVGDSDRQVCQTDWTFKKTLTAKPGIGITKTGPGHC